MPEHDSRAAECSRITEWHHQDPVAFQSLRHTYPMTPCRRVSSHGMKCIMKWKVLHEINRPCMVSLGTTVLECQTCPCHDTFAMVASALSTAPSSPSCSACFSSAAHSTAMAVIRSLCCLPISANGISLSNRSWDLRIRLRGIREMLKILSNKHPRNRWPFLASA